MLIHIYYMRMYILNALVYECNLRYFVNVKKCQRRTRRGARVLFAELELSQRSTMRKCARYGRHRSR